MRSRERRGNEALQQTRSALTTIAAALAAERRCCAYLSRADRRPAAAGWRGAMVGVLIGAAGMMACGESTFSASVVVTGTRPLQEKLAWAQAFATSGRAEWLRDKVRAAAPEAPEEYVRGLQVGWRQTSHTSLVDGGSSQQVLLVVSVRETGAGDPTTTLNAAVSVLQEAVAAFADHGEKS